MISIFKKWSARRDRKAYTKQMIKVWQAAVPKLSTGDNGIEIFNAWRCYMCEEPTHAVCLTGERTSLAGETFTFVCSASVYVCFRCKTIAANSDCSGCKIHINSWDPNQDFMKQWEKINPGSTRGW
jgi:hypothetical protein